MNNKRSKIEYTTGAFNPVDKANKKGYNDNGFTNKTKNVFDDDAFAKSALDYLYSDVNRSKTQSFLKNNGLPSFEDRQYNKKYYGEQEESQRTLDLFKKKASNILNPDIPNDTDRSFLKGFLGKAEEENNYKKKLSSADRALGELQDAFRGSQFEGALKSKTEKAVSAPTITKAVNRNLNAKNEINPVGAYASNKEPAITQLSNKKEESDFTKILGNTLKRTFFEIFSPNSLKPSRHTALWLIGAETYLKHKGYETSAWLLKHSLLPNPKDVHRDNNSRIAQLIKNDPAFLKELDRAIANSDGHTLDETISVPFEQGDLYYSIHKNDIKISGYKNNDGKWKISAKMKDKYNFSKLMTGLDDNGISLGTVANDVAFFSEMIGAITPYYIYVDFSLER